MNKSPNNYSRRKFIATGSMLLAASALTKRLISAEMSLPERLYTTEDATHGKRSLFDGKSLKGWKAIPRLEIRPVIANGKVPLSELEDGLEPPHYFAIMGYLPYSADTDAEVAKARARLMERYRVATTWGYGPRFLHSTGQFHKGGP